MANKNLPAGLVDLNTEIFEDEQTDLCYGIHKGQVKLFVELPEYIHQHIDNDIFNNKALLLLIEFTGSNDSLVIRERYARCCFGGFNSVPDIMENGSVNHDYHECKLRGKCKFEGKICQHIKVKNGYLTKQEVKILKFIGIGMLNKQIADSLSISEKTLPGYMNNISEKTGCLNKTEMGILAYKLGLL